MTIAAEPVPHRLHDRVSAVAIMPCLAERAVRAALIEAAASASVTLLDQNAAVGGAPEGRRLIVFSDLSALAAADIDHIVIVAGDPSSALTALVRERPIPLREAVVSTARCFANAAEVVRRRTTSVVREADLARNPADALGSLFRNLGLVESSGQLHALTRSFAAALDTVRPLSPKEQEDAKLAAEALRFYAAGSVGGEEEAWWPIGLFLNGDKPGTPCPDLIDMTGRSRILVYGPLMPLRSGRWRLTAQFELCDGGSANYFLLEFGEGPNLVQEAFEPEGDGTYFVTAENQWPGIGDAELRLWLPRPAFHGELRFIGASVERLGDYVGEGRAA